MKINVVLLMFYLVDFILAYFVQKHQNMKAARILAPRFAELKSLSENLASLKEETKMKPFNYKVVINVVKETDVATDKPKDIKTVINFTKDTINLLKKGEVVRSIPYRE